MQDRQGKDETMQTTAQPLDCRNLWPAWHEYAREHELARMPIDELEQAIRQAPESARWAMIVAALKGSAHPMHKLSLIQARFPLAEIERYNALD